MQPAATMTKSPAAAGAAANDLNGRWSRTHEGEEGWRERGEREADQISSEYPRISKPCSLAGSQPFYWNSLWIASHTQGVGDAKATLVVHSINVVNL
jgi:hypothetical protein